MGYIYAFRLGGEDLFKIGQTTMTPAKRRNSLQTGCPYPLSLFDAIETDEYKALEKYIKDTWADRRGEEGGSEIYRFTGVEVPQVFVQCRAWLTDELPKKRQVEQLEDVEPNPTVLPSDDTVDGLRRRWIELNAREQQLRIDCDRVAAEKTRVETELKLAIGTASGIAGVATWERTLERRLINPDLVKAADPELYEQCLVPKFEAAKLKTLLKTFGRHTYESFQDVKRSRQLKITE
ncbi:GIY-YIG nuclease family protein [Nocardia sp. NPDC004604]|uniref:GIY-YIG nuclease family protein n=1 Tax=Nocardia sp. NPDC004604 TaxID=3157013 RepID=UPI0033B39CFB